MLTSILAYYLRYVFLFHRLFIFLFFFLYKNEYDLPNKFACSILSISTNWLLLYFDICLYGIWYVFMCVYICIYTCFDTYVHLLACVCTFVYVCVCVCLCICVPNVNAEFFFGHSKGTCAKLKFRSMFVLVTSLLGDSSSLIPVCWDYKWQRITTWHLSGL